MKQSHSAFWAFGWVGVVAGSMLAALGLLSSDPLLNAVGGYGLVIAGCGLYLVAGLMIRQMVARRRTPNPTTNPSVTATSPPVPSSTERAPAAKPATQR